MFASHATVNAVHLYTSLLKSDVSGLVFVEAVPPDKAKRLLTELNRENRPDSLRLATRITERAGIVRLVGRYEHPIGL
jgi:hypothetical protein